MRVFDRDLIRGGHYGQRSCEPHLKGRTHGCTDRCCTREESPCQLGAVHTWPISSFGGIAPDRSRSEWSGSRPDAKSGPPGRNWPAANIDHAIIPSAACPSAIIVRLADSIWKSCHAAAFAPKVALGNPHYAPRKVALRERTLDEPIRCPVLQGARRDCHRPRRAGCLRSGKSKAGLFGGNVAGRCKNRRVG